MKIRLSVLWVSLFMFALCDLAASHENPMKLQKDMLVVIDSNRLTSHSPRGINYSPIPTKSDLVKHLPVQATSVHVDATKELIEQYKAQGRCTKNLEAMLAEFVSLYLCLSRCNNVSTVSFSETIAYKSAGKHHIKTDSMHMQIVKEKLADPEISVQSRQFYEQELADLMRYHN